MSVLYTKLLRSKSTSAHHIKILQVVVQSEQVEFGLKGLNVPYLHVAGCSELGLRGLNADAYISDR